mmetsp:Transcript_29797/g.83962  ORF Transcript_29797/g.83962 Transcript_29797/m.83962 type:complete len:276 (-) Transcript_29797:600-1427(-)
MAQERDKRESLKGKAGNGSVFWGASTKGTADVRKGKPVPTSGRTSGRPQQPGLLQAERGSRGSSASAVAQWQAGSGRKGEAAAGSQSRGQAKVAVQAEIESQLPLEANLHVRQQPINGPLNAGPQAETGVSCGTEDMGPSGGSGTVWDGEVDEEKNRREFQEALMAWRNAGKTATSTGSDTAASTGLVSKAAKATTGSSASLSAAPACMDTQTEPPPSPAPAAKPRHYFDKLLIEAQARAAGEKAASQMGLRPAPSRFVQAAPVAETAAAEAVAA